MLQEAVVCSHFVNAILYHCLWNGTVSVATSSEWNKYFKVTPSDLFREFCINEGLFFNRNAKLVGLQHKGELVTDFRRNSEVVTNLRYAADVLSMKEDSVKQLFE